MITDVNEIKMIKEELRLKTDILESVTDAIRLRDEDGRIVYVNKAACDLYGYSKDVLIGMNARDLTPPDRSILFGSRVDEVKKKGEIVFETIQQRKDRTRIPIENHYKILNSNGKEYFLAVMRNLSARERAREEDKLKALLLDSASDAVYLRDLDGNFIYVNEQAAKLYGYPKEELVKMNIRQFWVSEALPNFESQTNEIVEKNEVTLERSVKNKNGNIIPVEVHVRHITSGSDDYILGVHRDISERKRSEENLKASEEKFRNLVENAPVGISITTIDGRAVLRNKKITDMYGYTSSEEFMKVPVINHYRYAKDRQNFLKLIETDGIVKSLEVPVLKKDGTSFWTRVTAIPFFTNAGEKQIITITEDITDWKKTEAALKESEAKFKNLLDNAPVGIGITTIDGRPLVRNKKMTEILGYDQEELFRQPVSARYYNPRDRERLLELTKQGPVENFETRVRRKDGRLLWTTHTTIPQKTEFGDCFISVIQDITKRKKAERQIRKYHQRLRLLASKLTLAEEEERRRIAVGIHDSISQSLATCRFLLTDIQETLSSTKLSPKIIQIQNILKQSLTELGTLIFDLSCPLLYEAGLEAAVGNLTEEIGEQYKLKTEFKGTTCTELLALDIQTSILLYQIVREILINVGKHARAKKLKVFIRVGLKHVLIVVKDDGIGFNISKIEPLSKNGGFGLFSVRERLHYLGGRLMIRSSQDRGTQVSVRVPRSSNRRNASITEQTKSGKR